jgi:hypothetical protein
MPILTYTPEGADPIEWDFDFDRLLGAEVSAIEDATGVFYDDMRMAFYSGSWKVRHAVAWVLMKRAVPTLTIKAFEVSPGELPRAAFNLAEARRYVETYSADPDDDDREMIARLHERFGDDIYRKESAPEVTEDGSPKDE